MALRNVIRKNDAKNFDEIRKEQGRKFAFHRQEDGLKLDAAVGLLSDIRNSSLELSGGVKSIFR